MVDLLLFIRLLVRMLSFRTLAVPAVAIVLVFDFLRVWEKQEEL